MKKHLLILGLILSSPIYAGDGVDNSGDPVIIHYQEFPNQEKLVSAIELSRKYFEASGLHARFISENIKELDALYAKKYIRFLNHEIVSLRDFNDLDNEDDASIGAVTKCLMGAPIVLAARTKDYSEHQLASLLIHEVLHHTLWVEGRCENSTVAPLTDRIANRTVNDQDRLMISLGLKERLNYLVRTYGPFFKDDLYYEEYNQLIKPRVYESQKYSPEKFSFAKKLLSEGTCLQHALPFIGSDLSKYQDPDNFLGFRTIDKRKVLKDYETASTIFCDTKFRGMMMGSFFYSLAQLASRSTLTPMPSEFKIFPKVFPFLLKNTNEEFLKWSNLDVLLVLNNDKSFTLYEDDRESMEQIYMSNNYFIFTSLGDIDNVTYNSRAHLSTPTFLTEYSLLTTLAWHVENLLKENVPGWNKLARVNYERLNQLRRNISLYAVESPQEFVLMIDQIINAIEYNGELK